ncbi:MAG: HAD family hydrolase [Dehalococcoidia bacterium]
MIKALLFDFFNTLSHYEPPREQMYIDICEKHGIHLDKVKLYKSLPYADAMYRDENQKSPVTERPEKEQMAIFNTYITVILKGAGVEINDEIAMEILHRMKTTKWEFKLFDDVLPTFKVLRERGLITGLITNVGQEAEKVFNDVGLKKYLDFYATSFETGHDKPDPEIFLAALEKAGVRPDEALYTGDNYEQDVLGARGVGMQAILLDRNDWFSEINDCIRIKDLSEVLNYI